MPDVMEPASLQQLLDGVVAGCVRRLALRVVRVEPERVVFALPVSADLVHGGGVLCGQAIMAAADTALLGALIVRMGEFRPVTTVQLQTSFLRPVPAVTPEVTVVATVLRQGRTLSYGDVDFLVDDKLVAHATSTYAAV